LYPFLQDILITEDSSAVTIVIYNHINSVSIYSRSLIIVRLTSFYRIINLHFSIHFLFLTTLSWLWELCSNPRWPLNNQFMLTTEIASSVNTSLLHGTFSGIIRSYIFSLCFLENDSENYLLWCQQVEPIIKGRRLHHFPTNTVIPSKFRSLENCGANHICETYIASE